MFFLQDKWQKSLLMEKSNDLRVTLFLLPPPPPLCCSVILCALGCWSEQSPWAHSYLGSRCGWHPPPGDPDQRVGGKWGRVFILWSSPFQDGCALLLRFTKYRERCWTALSYRGWWILLLPPGKLPEALHHGLTLHIYQIFLVSFNLVLLL